MKISSKIAVFYLASTILLTLFLSLTLYFSYTKDLEKMTDEHLAEDAEQIKFLIDNKLQNSPILKRILFEEYWLKITKNNQTIYASAIANSIPIPTDKIVDNSTVVVRTNYVNFTGNNDVIFRMRVKKYDDGIVVALGIAMNNTINENRQKLISALLGALIIISILVYFLTKFLLKPLRNISLTLRKLDEYRFNIGFTKKADDEIGFLIDGINLTFEKLRNYFTYQKNFLTLISHELKTPLSVIKHHIEYAIEREDTPLELKQKLSNDLDQISKLNRLIHRLLLLARLEEKTIIPKAKEFNLSDLSYELIEFFADLANAQNKRLSSNIASGIFIIGDKELIYRAIFNILDNAIKYSLENDDILFSLEQISPNMALLCVKDSAGGINSEALKAAENSMFVTSQYDKEGIKNGVGLRLIISILKLHNINYEINVNGKNGIFKLFFKTL